jgi:pentalenic acid synthase
MSTVAEEIPPFPMDRACPYHPPAGYAQLREEGPIGRVRLFDGRVVWAVTGYQEARKLLVDPRLSSDRSRPDFPVMVPRMSAAKLTALVGMDPPEHYEQRRMLISAFSLRRVAAQRPQIERIVADRLDAVVAAGPPTDLVTAFALPIPSTVICLLLGVPYADHEFFESRTQAMVHATSTAQQAADASAELFGYFDRLVAAKLDQPGEGLLDELIAQYLRPGRVSRRDLASIAMFLLVAGHETTASMLTLSVLALLEHPDQLAALRADPGLIPGAVEELLRFLSVADEVQRIAAEDIEIGGVVIKSGDGVYLPTAAANRTASVFDQPDEFDVHRSSRGHMAFGFGIHQCLGQNLARAELEIALGRLIERLPGLRLARPAQSLPVKPGGSVQGVFELPVAW